MQNPNKMIDELTSFGQMCNIERDILALNVTENKEAAILCHYISTVAKKHGSILGFVIFTLTPHLV